MNLLAKLSGRAAPDAASAEETLKRWLAEADCLLVGMGAGLSASGGLNYVSPVFFQEHFPEYAGTGPRTVWEAISRHWDLTEANQADYWGYMARHIQVIRYEAPVLQPYQDLVRLLRGRRHFVISTNADGQALKAGIDPALLYTPQGEYSLLQCEAPCHDTLYDAKPFINAMLAGRDPQTRRVRVEDVPHCPRCGRFLVPNLRKDGHFVDALHRAGFPRYRAFLQQTAGQKMLLLELGVGYNTPVIIRFPFESMAMGDSRIRLARINLEDADVPPELGERALGMDRDIAAVLAECRAGLA